MRPRLIHYLLDLFKALALYPLGQVCLDNINYSVFNELLDASSFLFFDLVFEENLAVSQLLSLLILLFRLHVVKVQILDLSVDVTLRFLQQLSLLSQALEVLQLGEKHRLHEQQLLTRLVDFLGAAEPEYEITGHVSHLRLNLVDVSRTAFHDLHLLDLFVQVLHHNLEVTLKPLHIVLDHDVAATLDACVMRAAQMLKNICVHLVDDLMLEDRLVLVFSSPAEEAHDHLSEVLFGVVI